MARTNYTHRTARKHAEHQDATDIQEKRLFVFFGFFYLYFLFMILLRNVELPPKYGQWLSLGTQTSFKLKQNSHFLNTRISRSNCIC